MSENGVYPQWNSHLVGIMISKTIGCGVHNIFRQTQMFLLWTMIHSSIFRSSQGSKVLPRSSTHGFAQHASVFCAKAFIKVDLEPVGRRLSGLWKIHKKEIWNISPIIEMGWTGLDLGYCSGLLQWVDTMDCCNHHGSEWVLSYNAHVPVI